MEKSLLSNHDLFQYDSEYTEKGIILCGIDEAGRGPLAGDVYAAGVILPINVIIHGLNDSKKLSEKRRDALYEEIIAQAIEYHVATASVYEIEELNILGATLLAMKRVAESFSTKPSLLLIDGNQKPKTSIETITVVKGDGISASIAAASILAKVERDRYMKRLDEEYPEYEFHKHKGYGTKLHYEKIQEYGISPVHRKSFLKKVLADG